MGNLLRWLVKARKHPAGIGLAVAFSLAVGLSELTGFNARVLPDFWDSLTKENLTEETRLVLGRRLRELARDGSLSVDESQRLRDFAAGLNLQPRAVEKYLAELEPRVALSAKALQEGADLAAQRRFPEARARFQEAIASDDQNTVAWASLGAAALELGAIDDAEAALKKALKLDPDSIEANYNFGACLAVRKQNNAALDHLERSMSLLRRANGSAAINRQALLGDLQKNPCFSSLRSLPRFGALLRQAENEAR